MAIEITVFLAASIFFSKAGVADVIRVGPPAATNEEILTAAVKLLRNGQFEKSRLHLAQNFKDAVDKPHPDILLAQLLNELGNGPRARNVLEQLAVTEPNRFDVYFVFCEMAIREQRWLDGWMHALAADSADMPQNWSEQHQTVMKRDLILLKAACCEGRGDWKTARQMFESLIQDEAETPVNVLVGLGRAEFHLQDVESARQHFDEAFRRDNRIEHADLSLALLFDATGKKEEAEKYFQKAVAGPPMAGQGRSRIAFARWLIFQNRAEETTASLSQPIADDGLESERLYLQAMSARMSRQFEEARNILSGLHQQDPANFTVSNQLALILIEHDNEGLRGRALQIAESNVRNHAKSAEAWSTLGWIQFRLGDVASARESLSRGMSGGIVSRDTACYMAHLEQRLGNAEKAKNLVNAVRNSAGPLFAQLPKLPPSD